MLASLAGVAGLAWLYLLLEAARMARWRHAAMEAMPMPGRWSPWARALAADVPDVAVMMVGMMLPSAAPVLLLYAALARKNAERGAARAVWVFAAGYLAVWAGFSLVATILQASLETSRCCPPMMAAGPRLTGVLLVARRRLPMAAGQGRLSARTAERRSSSCCPAGGPGAAGASGWAPSTAPTASAAAGRSCRCCSRSAS